MDEQELLERLAEIRSLRSRGVITPKEAYERHLAAVSMHSRRSAIAGGAQLTDALRFQEAVRAQAAAPAGARSRMALDLLAVAMAITGGLLGIVGAIVQELQSGGLLAVFFAAPIIEEAMKPAGIYVLLTRWPKALRNQLHIAMLTGLSGLCFGLIESFVYVTLYFPEGGADYVLFRFTVPVGMHALASFVVGLGLSRAVIEWASGRGPLPKSTRNAYLAAVVLHAAYNTAAVILAATGVVAF